MNRPRVEALIGELLVALGEDPEREGLQRTPARVVDLYARRLQLQERLPQQIAEAMIDQGALGAGVVIEAKHPCMMMRGVLKQNDRLTY